jgi:hypothetical protein
MTATVCSGLSATLTVAAGCALLWVSTAMASARSSMASPTVVAYRFKSVGGRCPVRAHSSLIRRFVHQPNFLSYINKTCDLVNAWYKNVWCKVIIVPDGG